MYFADRRTELSVREKIAKVHRIDYTMGLNKLRKNDDSSDTGCFSKINEKTIWKLVKEAAKRPVATLKELQDFLPGKKGFLPSTDCLLHMSA